MSRRSRPSSLDEKVRAVLTSASLFRDDASDDDDDKEHVLEDVLRAFAEQSNLLLQTELLRSALTSDPFEHFCDEKQKTTMERLKRLAQVVDHHRVATHTGYSTIQATVRLPADATMQPTVQTHVQLSFRYERTADGDNTTTGVWYSIDLSKDHGPSERMLWVQVWALGNTPAPGRAKNIAQEDDDLWSDMEEDETSSTAQIIMDDANGDVRKNGCTANPTTAATTTTQLDDDNDGGGGENTEEPCDRFVAGIDADLLTQFLQWTRLGPLDDLTAFFLLMTFPFYEHEWDIVGLLLDAVFGMDGDDDDDDDDEMDSASE